MSEMAAASAAVAVFISVYILGFMHGGVLVTLLVGWIPAAALAWVTARALRAAARSLLELAPGLGIGGLVAGAALQPIEVSAVRRDGRRRGRGRE